MLFKLLLFLYWDPRQVISNIWWGIFINFPRISSLSTGCRFLTFWANILSLRSVTLLQMHSQVMNTKSGQRWSLKKHGEGVHLLVAAGTIRVINFRTKKKPNKHLCSHCNADDQRPDLTLVSRHLLDKSSVCHKTRGCRWRPWWWWRGLHRYCGFNAEEQACYEEDWGRHGDHWLCHLWGEGLVFFFNFLNWGQAYSSPYLTGWLVRM